MRLSCHEGLVVPLLKESSEQLSWHVLGCPSFDRRRPSVKCVSRKPSSDLIPKICGKVAIYRISRLLLLFLNFNYLFSFSLTWDPVWVNIWNATLPPLFKPVQGRLWPMVSFLFRFSLSQCNFLCRDEIQTLLLLQLCVFFNPTFSHCFQLGTVPRKVTSW